MWVLKLQKSSDGTLIGATAKEHKVSFSGYPLNSWEEGDRLIVRVAGFVEGAPDEVDSFIRAIEKEPFVKRVSCKNGFAIATLSLHKAVAVVYNPHIFFVQPARYGRDGTEVLELACEEKEPLMAVADAYRRKFNCRIMKFSQEEIRNIGLVSVHPGLTGKQRQALQLAVRHGYYQCPRAITLEQLAKLMGVSFSTYQAHLTKAEAKFMTEMAAKFL